MFKKLFKKIGKKIKKIGKKIGKPFKKLMKTKLGKVIGTIGMMMIGGWLMQGAKSFVGGLFEGQGVGKAFGNAIGEMGNAVQTSYNNITEGITDLFGGEKNAASNANKTAKKIAEEAGSAATNVSPTNVSPTNVSPTNVSPTNVIDQAKNTTVDGSIRTAGEITPSGNIVGQDIREGRIGKIVSKPETSSLLKPEGVDFATDLSVDITPDLTFAGSSDLTTPPKLPFEAQGGKIPMNVSSVSDIKQPNFFQRNFPKLSEMYGKADTGTEFVKDVMGYEPFKNIEGLPKFVRNTNITEMKAVHSLLQKPEIPYVQGSSDMSGAISSLSENTGRIFESMPMDDLMSRTQVPSPSTFGTADALKRLRQANFIYDTTLMGTA